MFGISDILCSLKATIIEAEQFADLCKSLPKHVSEDMISERKKRREAELQHHRNMEVAREGRALNFWGNR